jgi:hypothetical protein
MGVRRKQVNKEIRKDIAEYWNDSKKLEIVKGMRGKIQHYYQSFEKIQDEKVQRWAHRMVPKLELHADRQDIKRSIRRFMFKETLIHLNLQKYYPELFEDEKEKNNEEVKQTIS